MAWINGRSVAVEDRNESSSARTISTSGAHVQTRLPAVLLKAGEAGRKRMADGFFNDATLLAKVSAGAFTASVLESLVSAGAFAANKAGRALFAAGFVDSGLLEDGAVTAAKLSPGFVKHAVLSGSTVGSFKLSGIDVGDSIVYVHEQDGTSGIITDRTAEFKIQSKGYISNVNGTNTTGDKLLVFYLDLT